MRLQLRRLVRHPSRCAARRRSNAAGAAQRGRGVGIGQPPSAGAARPVIGGTAITEPANVRAASEKDVMTVLDMVRKEFNVDENRIYLMGHSMGGAGTLPGFEAREYLGGSCAHRTRGNGDDE